MTGEEDLTTHSGIPVQPCYEASDLPADLKERLGQPGSFPFRRGIYPEMYRRRPWTMRQYAGYGTAQESNRRYRYLLEQGQTGLSVAFDLPTQIGYDSDHPLADGEVGKVGVAIDTLADMERLFEGIPLGRVSTSMTINSTAAVILAMYVTAARRQGVEDQAISGTVQNDILKEYIASRIPAGALMVIEVETCSRGISLKRVCMSSSDEIDTPTFPTSPCASGSSASYPICVGRSKATERPVCPCFSRKR